MTQSICAGVKSRFLHHDAIATNSPVGIASRAFLGVAVRYDWLNVLLALFALFFSCSPTAPVSDII